MEDRIRILAVQTALALRDQDAIRRRVINRIARTVSELNFLDQFIVQGFDNSIRISMFVGDEDALRSWSVCNAVRIVDWSNLCKGPQSLCVNSSYFVLSSHRSEDTIQLRNCERRNSANRSPSTTYLRITRYERLVFHQAFCLSTI